MKQLIQNFKTGDLYVDEVPIPSLSEGMIQVETHFSLISAGTERGTVKVGQSNLVGKARQRPDLVSQVIRNIKKEGFAATFQKVKTKLDTLKALGYSTSGVVIASLDKDGRFKPGDRVACAGQDYASHSEIVTVPQNLVVKIPENVSFEEASFTTLGAIAMQGIRQAKPNLGENVCIIGLGLLGQITSRLLIANGCAVFGIDINEDLVYLANQTSGLTALNRIDSNLLSACNSFTRGRGFDTIIITAASTSNDPIELSAELARRKARIIVVGAVKLEIPREPHFYKKELDLRMSCSYGPGRYDINYESQGNDYPFEYVRWTEQRNMEAFLDLLSRKAITIDNLITHVFAIDNSIQAYDIVLGKTQEKYIGILLQYFPNAKKFDSIITTGNTPIAKINLGFIGAGSFAQSYLIPYAKALGASLDGVVTSKGISSKNVANKFQFNFCSSKMEDILTNPNINVVFIATPHALHSELVVKALSENKHVFVEKPLAINRGQLQAVIDIKQKSNGSLMIGFNRRFANISQIIKNEFESASSPFIINIRVNAGMIPYDHWIQQPDIGGGRIIGEVCHFIDLIQFFTNAEPISVYAQSITFNADTTRQNDNIAIIINLNDGSIANLVYAANGDRSLAKESVEIFCGGKIAIINDFKDGTIHKNGNVGKIKSSGKGHKEEIKSFFDSLHAGKESPISFRSMCLTTITTFEILNSLNEGIPRKITLDD